MRILILGLLSIFIGTVRGETPLLTIAEKSKFKATSTHAEVVDFCKELAKRSPLIHLTELGKSVQGKSLPLMVISNPKVSSIAEAKKSKKLIFFILGNIHAGEVAGKEGALMLMRDLTLKKSPLLKKVVLVVAPIFNADGNDQMASGNRPGQVGPEKMGVRHNAQGFDLNRDFVKLESPEVRALVKALNDWKPEVFMDLHTTNGSKHRYTLTYDGPRNPAGDERIVKSVRDVMLPAIEKKLMKHGFRSFFYGNFSRDRKQWVTYPSLPRYGISYVGLRNRISILSEAYSYATYKDRVLASRDFVRSCLDYFTENQKTVQALLRSAEQSTIEAGRKPRADSKIHLRFRSAALKKPFTVLGFDGEKPKDFKLPFVGLCEPTLSVTRPYAYLFPPRAKVVENLQRHGIVAEELREDIELDLEVYRLDKIERSLREFQKHNLTLAEASMRKVKRMVKAGTILVRTGQPLGSLAGYLLEPQAQDGLLAWNFFDTDLKVGNDFIVARLPKPVPLNKGAVRPLRVGKIEKKPLTWEALRSRKIPSFRGISPSVSWLDDGEHFYQRKEGKVYRVHARTGRVIKFLDPANLAVALMKVDGINRRRASSIAYTAMRSMDRQKLGFLFTHQSDLWYFDIDFHTATRLTKTKGTEELATFSPDGKHVAFVRGNNLFVVDLKTQTEKQITTDGSEVIYNGKADWVYYEEIFYRRRQAFWWSSDSSHLVFMRFDDKAVSPYAIIDPIPTKQRIEKTRYPKAGTTNPTVKLGMVSIRDCKIRWIKETSKDTLITGVGWTKGKQAYFYLQDRAQTWLEVCLATPGSDKAVTAHKEKSKGWIAPEAPVFLKDGSFLILNERSGWKQIYHHSSGKSRAVTSGEWEVRRIHIVDEKSGWIYFTGTRDSHIAENLYRVKLDGSQLTRLTKESGGHRVRVSPTGSMFVDSWSNHQTPTKTLLRQGDGKLVRQLDTNPMYAREEYRFAPLELTQIKTPDGFALEATVMKPPQFDVKKKYPVWIKVYGGPQMPTIHNLWYGGRVSDQVLASMGFVVVHVDPRSASGKGAKAAWSAHRQLGVQETRDLGTAVRWLCSHSWVDAKRIGLSGHSYGGYLTSYAMTHSKLFAAGIAGAPVTDWRNYDTIYTERYMDTPKSNAKGYDRSSVVKAAKNLHGKLLILHGLMDDNVHPQNTIQLIEALQRANRDFELMLYPRNRHGLGGSHYQRLTMEFMRRYLRPSQ